MREEKERGRVSSCLPCLRLLQRCARTAARTVDAASDPTDVPASTVSLARSAREVRGDTGSVLIQSLMIPCSHVTSFNLMLRTRGRQILLKLHILTQRQFLHRND